MSLELIGFPLANRLRKDFIKAITKYCGVKSSKKLFCFSHNPNSLKTDGWKIFNLADEFARQGTNIQTHWRISVANLKYDLCPTYPQQLVVPKEVTEDLMFTVAQIRVKGRVQSLTWGSPNGGFLMRASQFNIVQDDMTGFAGAQYSKSDETYMRAVNSIAKKLSGKETISIFDTCSKKEFPSHLYTNFYQESCTITCLGLPNEAQVQEALKTLAVICTENRPIISSSSWLEDIDKSPWLEYLSKLLLGATSVVDNINDGYPVVIQSESGVGILSVLSAIIQLILDPHFRTVKGLCLLIEKDIIYYGHKFGNFTGKKSIDEYSFIFLMFLDCVWQLIQQYPLSFQYREDLLLYLINSCYSCQYGTFVVTCCKDRNEFQKKTSSVWSYIYDNENQFLNPLYKKYDGCLKINPGKNRLRLWSSFYLRHKCRFSLLKVDKAIQTASSKNVGKLELSSLRIPSLPCDSAELTDLVSVTNLNLNDNILNKIPLSLVNTTNLKVLSLSNNQIPFIANEFLDLFTQKVTTLESLDLNCNQLLELSDLICRFKSLKELKLHGNLLIKLPDLTHFTGLIALDIGGNQVEEIPNAIFNMKNLEILNISSNMEIKHLPDSLVDLKKLNDLNISFTQIEELPPGFNQMTHLSKLDISSIKIEGIPTEVLTLTQLTNLSMGSLKISEIPVEISCFKNIKYLDLGNNHINIVPTSLLDLINLEYLDLRNNNLKTIPLDISKLDKLIELHLEHNQLIALTPGVGKLGNLRVLNVSHNNIIHLPGTIGYLSKLQESRQFIFSHNKSLKTPPVDIIEKGYDNVFAFLQLLLEGFENVYRMKVMVVGQENVGKTSLLRCLTDYVGNSRKIGNTSAGIDKNLSSATGLTSMSTDGIDIGQLDFKILFRNNEQQQQQGSLSKSTKNRKTKVDLSVWDFAGQEIYYTTHQFFLSDRALYIVVWNIAKKEEDSRVEYWLKSINARAPDAPVLIVATHLDDPICTKEYIDETVKALETKYCPQFPNIQGIHMISCTDLTGIQQLDLWIQAIVVMQPYMGEQIPKSFMELEKLVKEEKTKRIPPVVTWKEFSRMGFISNVKTADQLASAAGWLHNMGTIIYFQKHEGLNDIVILDPQWLTDVMSTIITTKHGFVKGGVLNHSDLPQLWRAPEFPPYLHRVLLNLLEQFEISFYLRSTQEDVEDKSLAIYTGRSLVPSLLPDTRPDIAKYWSHFPDTSERQFGRRYNFGFIPHGFISRLFVRVLHFAEPTIFWRNGMLVEHNDEIKSHTISSKLIEGNFAILIEAQPAQRIIDITIRGSAEKLAQLIIETIDSLISGWYSIKVQIEVPCIHCVRDNNYSPFMFGIEDCEQAAINGQAFIKCSGIRDIRLDELVPDIAMIHVQDCKLSHSELEIDREIGMGGFAIVYKGQYRGKIVAIKKIKFGDNSEASLDDTTELEAFSEFRREVWLMSGLFHLNIVQMEGFTIDPFCIITEFINHGNLYDLIHDESRELSWNYRWRCAMDMAKGMKYLHTTTWPPIIHRDLKSPNVLIDSLDEKAEVIAKVADFGLSQVLASTTQGRSVANPVWLAPEIMKAEEYTEKADVYSYGVMLYELASRQDFFGDTKFMSALENRVIEGERPVIPTGTPPEFLKLIELCWDGDPENRPSFVEICELLKEGINLHCPSLYDIACIDKEIIPVRNTIEKTGDVKRKKRTQEEIEAEARALEEAKRIQFTKEMNDSSKILNHLHDASIQCLLYLPPCQGRTTSQIWSGSSNGVICVWNLDGSLVETINAHTKQIFSMILVGDCVWTVSADEVIRIYLARNAKLKKEIKNTPILCLAAVGPKSVWGGGMDSYVYIYDAKGAKQKKKIRVIEGGPLFCIHLVESTGCIWIGTDLPGKSIVVVNSKGKVLPNYQAVGQAHRKKVNAIIESNGLIWSCSSDRTIMIWTLDGENVRLLQGHTGPIFSIAECGQHVWSASWDKKVILWDAEVRFLFLFLFLFF